MSSKKIRTFEYDEAWIYCVLNKISDFQVIKCENRKYGIFLKSSKKWITT
jgi:hypothetical protein